MTTDRRIAFAVSAILLASLSLFLLQHSVCQFVVLHHSWFGGLESDGIHGRQFSCAYRCYGALIDQGDEAFFLEMAGSEDPVVCDKGIGALYRLKCPFAAALLTGSLRDSNTTVSDNAVWRLHLLNDPHVPRLLQHIANDAHLPESVRSMAQGCLKIRTTGGAIANR